MHPAMLLIDTRGSAEMPQSLLTSIYDLKAAYSLLGRIIQETYFGM